MNKAGVEEPFTLTATATDGETIYALRYASNNQPPTLYYGCGGDLTDAFDAELEAGDKAVLILSEPLSRERAHWNEVPPSHFLVAGDGAVSVTPFRLGA